MAKKKATKPIEVPNVVTFETFNDLRGHWDLTRMKRDNPSCFNGNVSVRKFRVTIELLYEPVEEIGARLESMWRECDNYHHHAPLRSAAEKIGYTFTGTFGQDRKW